MNLQTALFLLPGLLIGITVHEFAHAWSASLLGDRFARRQGRVSLNPLRHLSPLGTLAILVLPFGWGRPVSINLYNFRHPKRDYFLSSVAGPLANFLVVAACLGLMQLTRHCYRFGPAGEVPISLTHVVLMSVVILNTVLGVLNLIPIPPLDGSKIWPLVIPGLRPNFGGKATWLFVAALLILMWTGSFGPLISGALDRIVGIMPTSDKQVVTSLYEEGAKALVAEEYARAEDRFSRALALCPWLEGILYDRACARTWLDNWQGALDDMNEAIRLDAFEPKYYETRATAFRALGRDQEAEADEAKARELRESMPPPEPADDPPH